MKWSNLYNPIMKGLLRSPFHGIISKHFIILNFKGRKSGKPYSVPVEYAGDGSKLTAFTQLDRVWWKNLQGGAAITITYRGKTRQATAETYPADVEHFKSAFDAYLKKYPARAKYFDVTTDANGQLNQDEIKQAASSRVTIEITLD